MVVSGSDEDMKAFYAKFTNKNHLSFQDFVPRPPEQEENWYEWNNANWGTKWDTNEEEFGEQRGTFIYEAHYMTAWAPPLAFMISLAKQFPALTMSISFFEAGMQFLGFYKWVNGELVERISYDYSDNADLKKLYEEHTEEQRAAWWVPDEDEEES